MCNGIFDICLTTLPRNLPVQFFNRLKKIRQNYGQESVAPLLAHPVCCAYAYISRCAILYCLCVFLTVNLCPLGLSLSM